VLDAKSLATKSGTVRRRMELSGQRSAQQSAHGFEVDNGPLRLSIDRTATAATSTMESFATAAGDEAKKLAPQPRSRLPVLGLGVLALMVGTAVFLVLIQPSKTTAVPVRTTLVDPIPVATVLVPALVVPAETPVAPVAVEPVAPVPTQARRLPKRGGALNPGTTVQNRSNSLPSVKETSAKSPKLPTAAAVWDPDSPVPP
jgi:hypothetical protein